MLVELITPLILATSPTAITISESHYSHATQSSTVETTSCTTLNGTQTFGINGQPWDRDSD